MGNKKNKSTRTAIIRSIFNLFGDNIVTDLSVNTVAMKSSASCTTTSSTYTWASTSDVRTSSSDTKTSSSDSRTSISEVGVSSCEFSSPFITNPKASMKDKPDLTAKAIGSFGVWQLRVSIIMALLKLPTAWYQLNIIFMAPPQDFWCKKPATFYKYTETEWRKICAPKMEEFPCLIFDTDLLLLDPNLDKTLIPLVPCTEFIYDTSMFPRTIVSEWNLVCTHRWLVHTCQVTMMWGILVGGIVFSYLADKHGRRMPLLVAIIIEGVTGLLASVIPWYWVFLCNWFILAMANGGISLIGFVLCMEVVSGKWRTIIPVLHQLPFGLGNAVMAGLAYWLRDWRKLELALGCLTSAYSFFWFWIPESPRWLIASGRMDKAYEVLVKAAKHNNRQISPKEINRLLQEHNPTANKNVPKFTAFLRSRNMRIKTILLSLNWFCTGLAFYTFAQYLGSVGGDIFLAVAVTGVVSAMGGLTCVYVVTKVGRKTALLIYQAITGICFVLLLLVPESKLKSNWERLLFAGVGFGGMAGTVPVLYLYSAEIFPTLGRNSGLCGVSTFARVGSMIAPLMLLLESFFGGLPLILLTIISACQILMILPLPETKNVNLPETLEEAEKI